MAYFRCFPQSGASGISIAPTSAIVPFKGVAVFTVSVTPSGSPDEENYTVTSSNTSVLTVTKSGMKVYAYGIALGSATITVSLNGHTATASTTIDYSGSYFVFNNNKYYYDFVLVAKSTLATGTSTVMQRYIYSGLTATWGQTYTSFNDSSASFRTTFQNYINTNFSTNLKNAMTTLGKYVVSGSSRSITETQNIEKFFLPSEYETGNNASTYPDRDSGIAYLNATRRFGETISGDTVSKQLSRSIYKTSTLAQRKAVAFKSTSPYYEYIGFNETYPIRPYFFLASNLHVRDEANSDGSYSIDWTGQSSKTIYNLAVGTIIRDDSGTGRTG